MTRTTRILGWSGAGLAMTLAIMQVVPYGRRHTNPPVTGAPVWDSPKTEQLARRACYDCHSNETRWPWYASVAPMSWRIQDHVDEGRAKLNFSTLDRNRGEADEAGEAVQNGEMPPRDYVLAHPEARLTAQERQALVAGLNATFRVGSERHGQDGDSAALFLLLRRGLPGSGRRE